MKTKVAKITDSGTGSDIKTRITISTDSTADLTPELYERYKIQVLPLGVVIKDKLYTDGVDVKPKDVYEAVEKQNIMPKSSAAPDADFAELFAKNADSECHIHFSISTKLSACYNNAIRAASDFPNVHIIDSKVLSSGTGLLAIIAREMDEAGAQPKEIVEKMKEYADKQHTSFVIDSLKYLYKGGRVSGLKLLGANILSIHPQLVMDSDGNLIQGKKFKGNFPKVVKEYTKSIIDGAKDANKDLVMITRTTIDPAIEKQMEEDLKAAGFKRIFHTVAGSVITCHCGRNTIGILYVDK